MSQNIFRVSSFSGSPTTCKVEWCQLCFLCPCISALGFLVLLLCQIFSELFQGLWKHSGESQGTQDEFLATYNNHAPG